jgi:hypothetical protein
MPKPKPTDPDLTAALRTFLEQLILDSGCTIGGRANLAEFHRRFVGERMSRTTFSWFVNEPGINPKTQSMDALLEGINEALGSIGRKALTRTQLYSLVKSDPKEKTGGEVAQETVERLHGLSTRSEVLKAWQNLSSNDRLAIAPEILAQYSNDMDWRRMDPPHKLAWMVRRLSADLGGGSWQECSDYSHKKVSREQFEAMANLRHPGRLSTAQIAMLASILINPDRLTMPPEFYDWLRSNGPQRR